ncbi:TonB-dependent receptor plug domain-containing protein [Phenylobacterium deserti]|nr:TonB-dependent receptor [Phenylobacterium deserti]
MSAAALLGLAAAASAQTAAPGGAEAELDTVIVTGTRMSGLRAVDSPAPVQVLDATALQRVGQSDLIQAIAQNVPSFNAQAFGGDTANLTLSARLRGLSPNHALVLVNGKRRHGTANLAVLGGPFQGGAAADLNFIPLNAIDHVEVLQDGAAAQYGTDAIAGVINLILKDKGEGGNIIVTGGQYFDKGGKTGDITASLGMTPVENSYLDLSFESRWHGHSNRGDFDPRVLAPGFAAQYPAVAALPNYPYVNLIAGDAEYRLNIGSFNFGYQFSEALEFYSFGTYGKKYAAAFENYRVPGRVVNAAGAPLFPAGFNPKEAIWEDDYAISGGLRGTAGGWNWDLSTTWGKDDISINTLASANASLYLDTGFTPTDFHAGDFINTQWTTTLDLAHEYDVGMAKPLTLALGAEYREETYEILPGDLASRYKEGSQSYPGFALTDAGKHERRNWAVYADVALSPVEALQLDFAVRHEDFSDFGDTTVAKATGRYDFNDMLAIRGTASTGFRAPTLAEQYYSATNVGPNTAFVQLPPNSPAARLVGVNGLQAEKSINYSVGFVAHPGWGVTATLDLYQIEIEDRIVGSGTLYGSGGTPTIPAVAEAIVANGNVLDSTVTFTGINIFTNGLDTRTRGADLVVTATTGMLDKGSVQWTLTANWNETEVTKIAAPPAQLAGASLFDPSALYTLEKASPKFRLGAGAVWTWDKLSVNLKESLYGPAKSVDSYDGSTWYQSRIKTALITDLEVAYQVTDSVRAAVGANNLFNTYPDRLNGIYRQQFLSNTDNGYVGQYPTFSPFGINGGYYYGRLTYTF